MAEGGAGQGSGSPRPAMLDADALMDEILAKKGPQKYTQGFSEDNWEEVRRGNQQLGGGKEGESTTGRR